MNSVSQVEQAMQTLFRQANQIARQTGFVQRNSKLSGVLFVQTLVSAWLANPEATREALAQMAASLGLSISPQGLSDRFTEEAACFLQRMVEVAVGQVIAAEPVAIPLLQRFSAVMLLDSTVIVLPDPLAQVWQGCGGNTQQGTQASVKLQVSLDLLCGRLQGPSLHDGAPQHLFCAARSPAHRRVTPGRSGLFQPGRVRRTGTTGGLFPLAPGSVHSRV